MLYVPYKWNQKNMCDARTHARTKRDSGKKPKTTHYSVKKPNEAK